MNHSNGQDFFHLRNNLYIRLRLAGAFFVEAIDLDGIGARLIVNKQGISLSAELEGETRCMAYLGLRCAVSQIADVKSQMSNN